MTQCPLSSVFLSALLAALSACATAAETPSVRRAAWAVAPQDYNEVFPGGVVPAPAPQSFQGQSLRQVLRLSTGGDELRVRLSNLMGSAPLQIEGAHVAVAGSEPSAIDAATDTALAFSGQARATIGAGQELWSDPVSFHGAARTNLAVTLYFGAETPVATVHSLGMQSAFLSAGNALAAPAFANYETRSSYYFLTGVDVSSAASAPLVVAFGDSITDGLASTVDASRRYPDVLADRLGADPKLAESAVVNAGISGNRVLHDVVGPAAETRFARDALGPAGASHIIILIGINDIGFSNLAPEQAVSQADIIAGLGSLVDAAHSAGKRVYLATLTPFGGTMAPYYDDAGEAKREAVNAWIRNTADADGVIDFDAAVRDPSDPLSMLTAYNSGDHLHPNDAGYAVMAGSIDLDLFR
jgi:lysophospholipase L1-like esterase